MIFSQVKWVSIIFTLCDSKAHRFHLLSHSCAMTAFSLITEMYANCAALHQWLIFIKISKAKKSVATSREELQSSVCVPKTRFLVD